MPVHRIVPPAFLTAAIVAALALMFFAPRPAGRVDTHGPIAVTSYPLYDIVKNVAGPEIPITLVVPPGANSHTFEPTPSTLVALAQAEVIYAIGHGFDDWVEPLLGDLRAEKVVVDAGIAIRPTTEPLGHEDADDEEEHGPTDPHYWLSLANARIIAATVAADLAERFPELAPSFKANAERYAGALDAADAQMRATLAGIENRKIVTLHDAWYYFAEAYGLEIVGSFEPSYGEEPTPRYLARLASAVEEAGVDVIYLDEQRAAAGIEPFLADNDLDAVELDAVEGRTDRPYIDIMLDNARIIAENQ